MIFIKMLPIANDQFWTVIAEYKRPSKKPC